MRITLDGADLAVYTNAFILVCADDGKAIHSIEPGFLIFSNETEANEAVEWIARRDGIECIVAPIIIKSRKV